MIQLSRATRAGGPVIVAALACAWYLTAWASVARDRQAASRSEVARAEQLLGRELLVARTNLARDVSLLADDPRLRATIGLAEAESTTLEDILADLVERSGIRVLAVLDAQGRVFAAVGASAVEGLDLKGSSLLRPRQPTDPVPMWLLSDEVLITASAPIAAGPTLVGHVLAAAPLERAVLEAVATGAQVEVFVLEGERILGGAAGPRQGPPKLLSPEQRPTLAVPLPGPLPTLRVVLQAVELPMPWQQFAILTVPFLCALLLALQRILRRDWFAPQPTR